MVKDQLEDDAVFPLVQVEAGHMGLHFSHVGHAVVFSRVNQCEGDLVQTLNRPLNLLAQFGVNVVECEVLRGWGLVARKELVCSRKWGTKG